MCLRTNSSTDIQARIIKNSLTNHDLYTKVRAGLGGMRIDACSYSCRNVSAGSSDDARMAGRMATEAAMRKNSPAMLTKVKGSVGLENCFSKSCIPDRADGRCAHRAFSCCCHCESERDRSRCATV